MEQCVIQVGAGLDGLFKTPACEFDVYRIEFNPDVSTAMLNRYDARRCGAGKRIKHDSTFRTSSQHARSRQLRWEHGEVGTSERLCRHRPDGAFIASVATWRKPSASVLLRIADWRAARRLTATAGDVCSPWVILSWIGYEGLFNGFVVVTVFRRLAEQEDLLMRLCGPILHAFRHRIGLVPDDFTSQVPAIGTKRKSQHPGNADQVFSLQPIQLLARRGSPSLEPIICLLVCLTSGRDFTLFPMSPVLATVVAPRAGIAITNVQPKGSVITQHPAHFPKHSDEPFNVLFWCLIQANLTVHAIITKTIVRWRRDTAVHGIGRQGLQHFQSITAMNDKVSRIRQPVSPGAIRIRPLAKRK